MNSSLFLLLLLCAAYFPPPAAFPPMHDVGVNEYACCAGGASILSSCAQYAARHADKNAVVGHGA